jgi:hypothetical protein
MLHHQEFALYKNSLSPYSGFEAYALCTVSFVPVDADSGCKPHHGKDESMINALKNEQIQPQQKAEVVLQLRSYCQL